MVQEQDTGLDLTSDIIEYENGDMSNKRMVILFGKLVKTGLAWQLQGSYGRTAKALIESGTISTKGDIDWARFEEVFDEDSGEFGDENE